LFHVFEHLRNPPGVLAKLKKLLKEGGYLILSFPNSESIQCELFKKNWFHLDPPRHLFVPASSEIRRDLQASGFKIVYENHLCFLQNTFSF